MKLLNAGHLTAAEKQAWTALRQAPVTILQIGEGNFLRGFFNWMIEVCRDKGLFDGGIAVMQPRPTGKANIEKLAAQDGLYTLVIRGIDNGKPIEKRRIINVFSRVFNAYEEWDAFLRLAESPDLKMVVTNTTEAGLIYRPETYTGEPLPSTPGKIALLLYHRYNTFAGDKNCGLVFLPCELLARNGDTLREIVLKHAADWGCPAAFLDWVKEHNVFLNSLVDRIVTGYPDEAQAEQWFSEWGYRDELLVTAEPYHLWAIEADPAMEHLLPLRRAGLNVHWTDDLTPFQQRKVRLLNGAHTWMAPIGLLSGIEHVRAFVEHPALGPLMRDLVTFDLVPTLPYPEADMRAYAETVFERFANPFIRHRLADIALNSLSKFKARLLPALAFYAARSEPIPPRLVLGLAGLLRYGQVEQTGDGRFIGTDFAGERYEVRDDAKALSRLAEIWRAADGAPLVDTLHKLLSDTSLFGADLSAWPGLTEAVAHQWNHLELEAGR